jgi:hypothetical protein
MVEKIEWKSEEEMQRELQNNINGWKKGYSKDGFIQAGKGEFSYKGIHYLLRVIRYYNHTNKFCSMLGRISDKHVVVEYPEETKDIADLVKSIDWYSEFLYHDTLHLQNDDQTVEEQILKAHELAKKDIDNLYSDYFEKELNNKISELHKIKDKLIDLKNRKEGGLR